MKHWTKLLAVLAITLTTATVAPAQDKPEKKAKKPGLSGTVVKVDGGKLVVSTGKKAQAKEVTVETDDKTVVMVEGQTAKLADLKPGQRVTITPESGTAAKIAVPKPKAKKDAK